MSCPEGIKTRGAPRLPTLFALSLLLWTAAFAVTAFAERLPIKAYTTADGLARDQINRIVRDSRGFLWFCTTEGLSRFDGYRFTSYGIEDGLASRSVKDLLETRDGVYWVATAGGVCRFNPTISPPTQGIARAGLPPTSQPRFVPQATSPDFDSPAVNALLEDRDGVIWCGTDKGLYRLTLVDGDWRMAAVDVGLATDQYGGTVVSALLEDRRGELWIGGASGLYRRSPDGRVETCARLNLPCGDIRALLEDGDGNLWIGATVGLSQVVFNAATKRHEIARVYTTKDSLLRDHITALWQSADGNLWIGAGGVSVLRAATGRLRTYTTEQGLRTNEISALAEDRDGNLWMGCDSGAMKLARGGLTTYGEADGLGGSRIIAILQGPAAEFYTLTGRLASQPQCVINQFDGERFTATALNLPADVTFTWGWYQVTFQDHAGEWWLPTTKGIFRYPRVQAVSQLAQGRPRAVYSRRQGVTGDEVFRLFEDSRGDIWISVFSEQRAVLMRWERASGKFYAYSPADNIPDVSPTAFCEDAAGNLWTGYYRGGLTRYAAGKFTRLPIAEGLEEDLIRALYLDRQGRLWVATGQRGLLRIDEPAAAAPQVITYTTEQGLSSNQITCVTEDEWGRIYVGTGRGIDRLDAATGGIKHYTVADGLAHSFVNVALRDRAGALWFGTLDGLSRLQPQADEVKAPPPIWISGLRIVGLRYPVSELGELALPPLELSAAENQLEIDFFGLSFDPGEALRYQYQLEGSDADWKPFTEQRTVNYASLSPGDYRFRVRAVSAAGVVSETPASVSFRILPPIWQRWWFVTLAALLVTALLGGLDRYRAARLRALKESEDRFRTLAETASDAIITIDEQGHIVFVNPAAEQVFGYRAAEMLGRDLTMLMPEYLRHLHRNGLQRYIESGRRHLSWEAIELPGLHQSGREIPLEISFGEFIRNERHFFTGVARDITERRRAAELLQRSREERLREIEQVRRRIATDLHDDIGSSLTQISILSEVARRDLARTSPGDDAPSPREPLAMIANASRELVDSMSDIVWAINPQKDHLSDLTQRMRRFASDSFTARNIRFRFLAPGADKDVRIGANLRREVFLIFKEGVNNLVRHSGCTAASIEFCVATDWLTLTISDNGAGFDPAAQSDGHGLLSMRERAREAGGSFDVQSASGSGTSLTVKLPFTGATSSAE